MRTFMHPVTVLLLDDNINFIKSTIALLGGNNFFFKFYENPNSVIDVLDIANSNIHVDDFFIKSNDDNIFFSTLGKIYDPLRFSSVSVVVSDYEMPIITGLDFFKKIKRTKLFKVMLTGIATEALAASMIKDGLINNFIRKNDYDFTNILKDKIIQGTDIYFDNLDATNYSNAKLLNLNINLGNDIKTFIANFISKSDISEYYSLDENGSYLFVDAFENISAIFIYDKDSILKQYHKIRKYVDLEDLELITKGEKIITIPIWKIDEYGADIKNFICNVSKSENGVMHCFVKDASYLVEKKKILFFNEFKSKISLNQKYLASEHDFVIH